MNARNALSAHICPYMSCFFLKSSISFLANSDIVILRSLLLFFYLTCAKIGSGTAPQFYPFISVVVDPIKPLGGRTVSVTLLIHLLSGGPILAYIGVGVFLSQHIIQSFLVNLNSQFASLQFHSTHPMVWKQSSINV